jgi:hypothetical protein
MRIINPDALPSFWWAFPWTIARDLHKAAVALKAYADRLELLDDLQTKVIEDQSREIQTLRMELETLNDSIVAGKAIVPDATPVNEEAAR